MEGRVKLGRVWGIPIGLHMSWFLIFALVTWSLADGYFPVSYPGLSGPAYWGLGLVASLFFFSSVLLHELGHAIVALRSQIPVRGITLFIFGGLAQIAHEPRSAGAEFRIAIAGPLVSLGLAILFGAVWLLGSQNAYLAAPSAWLCRVNWMLAVFNMIPGFPLDGGRVLRALAWRLAGNFYLATRVATTVGQVIALGFIGMGAFTALEGYFFNGGWLIFVGWFLQNAAAATHAQTKLQHSLRGVRVNEVITPSPCSQVSGQTSLARLVGEQDLPEGEGCFLVVDDGRLRGTLTTRDIAKTPRAEWPFLTAEQLMVPWEQAWVWVQPDMEVLAALQVMDDADVTQVPVIEDGRFTGVLSREQVLHFTRARASLPA